MGKNLTRTKKRYTIRLCNKKSEKPWGRGTPCLPSAPRLHPFYSCLQCGSSPGVGGPVLQEIRKGMDLTLGQRSCQDQGKRTSKPAFPGSTNLCSSEWEGFNNRKIYSPLKKKRETIHSFYNHTHLIKTRIKRTI